MLAAQQALGPRNRRVSELRRLLRRRAPSAPVVVLEGPRIASEALAAGIEPSLVVTIDSALSTPAVSEILRRVLPGGADDSAGKSAGASGCVSNVGGGDAGAGNVMAGDAFADKVMVVNEQAFRSLAPSVNPQPLLMLVDRPQAAVPAVLAPDDLVLVLVDVADPGNTGTIIRTAEACAARCVVAVGGADPWAPKAVRASAGSVLRVPVVQARTRPLDSSGSSGAATAAAAVLAQLRSAGARIVAADAHQGEDHDSGVLAGDQGPVALVLGSEAHGLHDGLQADQRARIPLAGETESLNVAMAATLLAFEYRRGRAQPTGGRSSLACDD
ncbi:MAG: RNA methyltransferase [Acidimicrobiaceae bacterium]|nr:RNA methyltransferase [Acidimicrobiaceae bacterium]